MNNASHTSNTMWVFFCIVFFLDISFGARILEECVISPNGDLSDPQPLLLSQESSTHEILYPNTRLNNKSWGGVKLYKGAEFELACPGTGFSDSKEEIVTATCVKGTTVKVGKQNINLNNLKCSKPPKPTARWTTETCADEHNYIEIGYEVEKDFLKLIKVCFDDNLKIPLYSVHTEVESIYAYQRSYPRVDFEPGQFYKGVIKNINSVYSISKQREQISNILGSNALGSKYIGGTNDGYYFARGHLAAKADFVYGSQQSATFFYVNVVPQWQTFNAGNWAALEDSVRTFVAGYGNNVTVYTGTYGVATLPDAKQVDKELYLYTDSNNNNLVPVPKLMWKLLYSESSSAGVVFIGVNNPYLKTITDDYSICTDVCDQIKWLTWDQTNIKKGYSYCCEVNDFLQTVKTLPELTVTSLLK